METPFTCAITAFGDGQLVTVSGEVDLATAPQVAEALAQAANGTVRVDISAVLAPGGVATLRKLLPAGAPAP